MPDYSNSILKRGGGDLYNTVKAARTKKRGVDAHALVAGRNDQYARSVLLRLKLGKKNLHNVLVFGAEHLFARSGDLVKLGTPMAIKTASIMISKLFVNSWINSYGVAVSAFAGIANKTNLLSLNASIEAA